MCDYDFTPSNQGYIGTKKAEKWGKWMGKGGGVGEVSRFLRNFVGYDR